MKQAQNDPFKVEDQVAIIYVGSKNLLIDIPVERIKDFESEYIRALNQTLKFYQLSNKESLRMM